VGAAFGRHRQDPPQAVHMAGDDMAAQLVAQFRGALEVDAVASLPAAQRGLRQRLAGNLDREPAGALLGHREAAASVADRGAYVDSRRVPGGLDLIAPVAVGLFDLPDAADRSEEHTLNSSHVKISYAVFCL